MIKALRKDLLLILAVAAVFVSLSYAIGFVTAPSTKTVELNTAFLNGGAPKAQPTTVRVWRKPAFEKTALLDSASLKSPAKIQANNNGNIFVLDWSDLRVKEFSPDGKLLKSFGDEVGTPNAFVNPTGFAMDTGGNMWVCDFKQERVGIFHTDGSHKSFKLKNTVYRMAALGDVMITMVVLEHSRLFETYDLSGRQLNSFGELLEDQANKAIALDGDIVADTQNHGIIYGGRYLGIIGAYDAEGKQRFLVQTIDHVQQPMVLNVGERMRKIKPNTALPVLSLSIVDNELFVLSGIRPDGSTGPGGKIIDVYNKQNGNYLYSWELPADGQEAVVVSNYIYIRHNKEVSVWSFKSNP
jgi:hypothetical protein